MKVSKYKLNEIILHTTLAIVTAFHLTSYSLAEPNFSIQAEISQHVDILTGFNGLKGTGKSFERIDVNEDNTPFLHDQIKGRKNIWLVEVKNVKLKLKSATPYFEDRYVRNFKILVDPNDGSLLKITSKFEGYASEMKPEPNSIIAEAQLADTNELYLGFPIATPNISFLDALDAVLSNGIGSPFLAKEIDAVYVWHSQMGSEPRRVWIITLRGLPPRPIIGPAGGIPEQHMPPVWQRNHIRNVVDANTGEVLFANNLPQPEVVEKSD